MTRSIGLMNAALIAIVCAAATFFGGFTLGQHSKRQSMHRERQRSTDAEERAADAEQRATDAELLSVDTERRLEAETERRVQSDETSREITEGVIPLLKIATAKRVAMEAKHKAEVAAIENKRATFENQYAQSMKLVDRYLLDAAQFFGLWKPITNWSFIRTGMTRNQVRLVLGEPTKVVVGGLTSATWKYYWTGGSSHVTNDVDFVDGVVASWQMGRIRKGSPSHMEHSGLVDDTDPNIRRKMLDMIRGRGPVGSPWLSSVNNR